VSRTLRPHDALFRKVFSVPRHAAGLLRVALPPALQAALELDADGVRVLDPTHVGPRLRGTASDVVLEVRRRRSDGSEGDTAALPPALVVFAIEQQARDRRFTLLRLHTYNARLWERWLRANPKATRLPPVVPVIVHTGRRPWRSPTQFQALIDLPRGPGADALRGLLPEYGCVLLDLAAVEVTRTWLRGRAGDAVSETALEVLQAGSRPESVALFDGWVERLGVLRREPGGASTLAAFLWYLLTVSPIEDARIIEAAEELPEPVEEEFMTGLERLRRAAREEGREEGREAGREEGREAGREEGHQAGREEGREAGMRHALAATLHKLLRLRFGGIPAAAAMRIEAAPTPELERWIEGVLTAESLEALLD